MPGLTSNYDIVVAIPAAHYLEFVSTDTRPYRARIQFEGENGSVIGANALQGHTVVFELDNNRVGFAESRYCTSGPGAHAGLENIPVASSAANTNTNADQNANNAAEPTDDMFVAEANQNQAEDKPVVVDITSGTCDSAGCRSFLAISYLMMGTALAVAYRLSRPKERMPEGFGGFGRDPSTRNGRPLRPRAVGGVLA